MKLRHIALRNFRCFKRTDIEFTNRITLITGMNGSGKSSLLEAIHVCGTSRSFRTSTMKDLIQEGAPAFSLRAQCVTGPHIDEIHIGYGANARAAEINGTGPVRRYELRKALPLVSITEEDIALVQGYPEVRRSFIDQVAAQKDSTHITVLTQYMHLLKQRLALLQDHRMWHNETYHILTEKLWELSGIIRTHRAMTLQELFLHVGETFPRIAPSYEPVSYTYLIGQHEQGYETPSAWCEAMHQRERLVKRSLCGAHLDDILFTTRSLSAQRFGSRGMHKLLAVLLRLAQARMTQPLILLDDIMADFDEQRLMAVLHELEAVQEQLIVTSPLTESNPLIEWARARNAVHVPLTTQNI